MAKPKWHTRWKVLPHDPIRKLDPDLWEVTGPIPKMPLRRRMTLMRLTDGRVVVHNAVCLEDELMAEIEAWGRPAFLIVPNAYHRIDAFVWTQRYPDIQVIAGPAGHKRIGEAVTIAGGPELLPADGGLAGQSIDGDKIGEMAFIKRHADGRATLIVNDIFWNEPHIKGFTGLIFRALGSTGGPRITRVMKLAGLRDKKAARAHLERLSETPGLARIIMSHGDIIEHDAAATLRQAAQRYL